MIGYGSQGHAHALNLKDSGVDVVVGLREGSSSWEEAEKAGLEVMTSAQAAAAADVVMLLVPDQHMGDLYAAEIAPHLNPDDALFFAHGFNIHFDVIDVAARCRRSHGRPERTRSPGTSYVHRRFRSAVPAGRPSGRYRQRPEPSGCPTPGRSAGPGPVCSKTTFKEETETDLFGEQVILCGGVSSLIKASFETLVEAGYQPESAYFETLHELKLIVDLLYEGGLSYMRYSVSDTAEYGDYTRGPRIVTDETRAEMKRDPGRDSIGRICQRMAGPGSRGRSRTCWNNATANRHHPVEKVGAELRTMMPFLTPKVPPE